MLAELVIGGGPGAAMGGAAIPSGGARGGPGGGGGPGGPGGRAFRGAV